MWHKTKLFVTASVAIVLYTTNVSAETTATPPPCKTKLECTKLADDLQAQIDELEAKGIENLTEKEFNKLDALSDELLAAMRAKTAAQDKEIAAAKARTTAMKKAQDKKIEELRGLLSK